MRPLRPWLVGVSALCILLVITTRPAQSQSASDSSPSIQQGVILCHEADEPARGHWDTNVILAIGRALGPAMADQTIGIRREACSLRMPDATCFGAPRLLQCRVAALKRILVASG